MPADHEVRNGSSGTPAARATSGDLARWFGALFVTTFRWLGMRVPLYRRNRFDEPDADLPDFTRPLPGDPDTIQRMADGRGALYHRHFWIDITDTPFAPDELIPALASNLNAAAPGEFTAFESTSGDGSLQVGDELVVRLPGPWDGPVRVIDRTPTSFRFVTLAGHMEAGEIEFRATTTPRGFVRFEIETWARAGDERFRVLYDALPLAREAQAFMWAHFCVRIPKLARGIVMSNVAVNTSKYEVGPWAGSAGDRPTHETAPVSMRARRLLRTLPGRDHNFDPDAHDTRTPEAGWNLDDYCVELPSEPPGPPLDDGPFATACRLCERYRFPDPDLVRAVWFDDVPLAQRDLIVEGRFARLRFPLALRVGEVLDRTEDVDGRPAQRYGFNYRTLEGHLERGQMDFEVRKWLDSGRVEFRIHAYSQRAHIDNPFVRLGMWLFGRSLQLRFARLAVERMRRLVEERVDRAGAHPTA